MPPQHGAWAFLLVPFVGGVVSGGTDWAQVPLAVAWLGGYLLSYYALLAVKSRRPARVRPQLTLYAAITIPAALVVLALRPELLAVAPVFAVLLAVNAWYAHGRRDRAFVNDLASVVQGSLMLPIAAATAGADPLDMVGPFAVVLAYFVGTVLFVKTMIRARGDERYQRASVAYHAVAAAAVGLVAWPFAVLFTWFLARAVWLPRRRLTPKRVGLVEIANCAGLLALLAATAS